ncbi:hypothetical protein [Streptomyces sp. NPDC058613]|uniref:hypothetical protein n=1 Tax=unclassified Streptomyces TaxID=2593676 RepID=UPI00364DDFC1
MIPAELPKVITRHRDGRIHAYVIDSGTFGLLEPAATFRPWAGDEVVSSVVRPDLERAVYTTLNRVVCLTRAGEPVWTSTFEPHSDVRHGHRPGCAMSLDGRTVWIYRPDAMAGRGGGDQWVVYDADTGAVLARQKLETVGHGAGHHVHPVDGSIYLDIGEGQDGSVILRGTAAGTDGEVEFVTYPWSDRCLIDLAPGGEQFMTVDHGQADIAFHHHPSGAVLFTLPVEAFGCDPEETFVEWSGGYLTPDTAVVALGSETEDGEGWFRHHLIDVRTGTISGEMTVESAHPYDLEPLGDGSWLTEGPVRWSRDSLPPSPPHPAAANGAPGPSGGSSCRRGAGTTGL